MAALTDSGTLSSHGLSGPIKPRRGCRRGSSPLWHGPCSTLQTKPCALSFSAQPLFWEAAVELSGDPCIGLHLGEKMPVYKGQILEYLTVE